MPNKLTIISLPLSQSKAIHIEFWRHFNHNVTYDVSNKLKDMEMKCLFVAKIGRENGGFTSSYMKDGEEVGVTVVKEEYRNQGVATELIKKRTLLRPWIVTHIRESNIGSIKAAERAGLQFNGRSHLDHNGNKIRTYTSR